MSRKPLKLLDYRAPKAQFYTVEYYCHKGERMAAPVKRLKKLMVVTSNSNQAGGIVTLYNAKAEEVDVLTMANVTVQQDGVWIYGVEGFDKLKHYYQVLALVPEPNDLPDDSYSG